MYADNLGEYIEDWLEEKIENEVIYGIAIDYIGIMIIFAGIIFGLLTICTVILGIVVIVYGYILGGAIILFMLPAILATISYYGFGTGSYLLNLR